MALAALSGLLLLQRIERRLFPLRPMAILVNHLKLQSDALSRGAPPPPRERTRVDRIMAIKYLLRLLLLPMLFALFAACSDPSVSIIDTSLNSDTRDGLGPFEIVTLVAGYEGVDKARVYYRADRGDWSSAELRQRVDGRFVGHIAPPSDGPPWPLGTFVEYYVEVTPTQGDVLRDPPTSPQAFSFAIGAHDDGLRLTDVVPRAGPASGGTTVFLTGGGFRSTSEVRFGAARAVRVEVISSGFIRAETPPGEPGLVDVTVTDGLGHFDTLEEAFRYLAPPRLTAIDPDHGPTRGGTEVHLTGADFASDAVVTFGDVEATEVEYVGPTLLIARSPEAEAGATDVTVTNPDGQTSTLEEGYLYQPPPTLTRLDPDIGPTFGGTIVRLIGEDFQEGAAVTFDNQQVLCRWLSAEALRCTTRPHPEGFANITVVNPDGERATLFQGFEFLGPPQLLSITPNEGLMSGDETVTIRGVNFYPGAEIFFGDDVAECEYVNREELRCLTPRSTVEGLVDVTLTNPDGQSAIGEDFYLYLFPPPEILEIAPDRVSDLGGVQIVITVDWLREGASVDFDAGFCSVVSITVDPITFQGEVLCVTPFHPEGFSDATVTNPDGQSGTLIDGIRFMGPPRIFAVEPPQGFTEGDDEVRLIGENFIDGMTVTFDGQSATVISVSPDGNSALVTTPAHPRDVVDVSATNPDGRSDTLIDGFEYVWRAPIVDFLDPDRGPTWGGGRVSIIGRFFRPGARVIVGGVELSATNLSVLNDAQIDILSMPPGAPGETLVEVINTDGQGSNPGVYTYAPIELSPDGGLTAGFTTVNAQGFDFVNGLTITVAGQPAITITVLDENGLTFVTPPGPLGAQDVIVTLPDGRSETITAGFMYRHLVERVGSDILPSNECQTLDLADFNGDGLLDVVVGNGNFDPDGSGGFSENTIQLGDGDGSFSGVTFLQPNDRTLNHTLGDIDGDNDIDIVTINLGGVTRLHVNDGAGNFALANNQLPFDAGDLYDGKLFDTDNDGDLDLFLLNHTFNPDLLWINSGNGVFTDESFRLPVDTVIQEHDHDVSIGDINGDGAIDALVVVDNANGFQGRHIFYINDGAGGFTLDTSQPITTTLTSSDVLDTELIDIDGDGDLDAIIADNLLVDFQPVAGRNGVYIFRNNGAGSFVEDTSLISQNLVVDAFNLIPVDFDSDGDLDLVVSTASDTTTPEADFITKFPNQIFVNDGAGVFHDASISWSNPSLASITVGAGDLDGDGHPDLTVCNFGSANRVYWQRGN